MNNEHQHGPLEKMHEEREFSAILMSSVRACAAADQATQDISDVYCIEE